MQSGGGGTTKSWKRGSADWREGPAFLDATSSVSASTFGARRLPELKSLYFATRPEHNDSDHIIHERKNLLSGGGKRSSRHLRRRTTAIHSRRHRHRYPSPNKAIEYKGSTRKSKRKKTHHLESEHLQWLSPKVAIEAVSIDENDESDQLPWNKMWQVTHRWHAKRFHLLSSPLSVKKERDPVLGKWTGIPLVHTNRGPRAAIRLSQNKDKSSELSSVMVRDVTWEVQPLLLRVVNSNNERKLFKANEAAQFLLQNLGKICPGLLQPAGGGEALSDFFSGKLSIQETLYEPDSFPSGAIGPGSWRMLPGNSESAIEIRCHPSIRPRIQGMLQQLASNIPSSSSLRLKLETVSERTPRICFRLFGIHSLNALNKVLALYQGNEKEFLDKHKIRESSSGILSNGSIIRIKSVMMTNEATNTVTDDIVLIYRAPRSLDCPANCAIAGWEVHCTNAVFAKALWLSLVTLDDSSSGIRGCCAIGLIEDYHMRLECEPPIPVFPRDYVDTEDSHKYWGSSSASCSWKRIRQVCEGGWGRLPIEKEKRLDALEMIDFGKFVPLDESESETGADEDNKKQSSIVVVRGAFGQPFVDAIRALCGSYASSEGPSPSTLDPQITKRRRRNRRPSCPKNKVILSPPLSEAARISLADYCRNLSSSLTLPAALLVHIRAIGKGTIAPGMGILGAGMKGEGCILGKITSGGFSSSRGVCHGIGMVGAVRLLDYLVRTTSNEENDDSSKTKNGSIASYGRIVRLANGSQSRQLLVRVVNMKKDGGFENNGCEASLVALI